MIFNEYYIKSSRNAVHSASGCSFMYDSILLREAFVGVQPYLCKFFCLLQKLCSLVWEHLVEGCETHLTFQEVLELAPVRLFAVE